MKLLRLTMMGDDIFFSVCFWCVMNGVCYFYIYFFCCFLCLFSKLWLLSTTQLIRLLRMVRDFALIFFENRQISNYAPIYLFCNCSGRKDIYPVSMTCSFLALYLFSISNKADLTYCNWFHWNLNMKILLRICSIFMTLFVMK